VTIAIVDYGIGNLRSIQKMFEKLGFKAEIAAAPAPILAAERLVLPGVGHFGAAMAALRASGLLEAVAAKALGERRPLLGICVGMQLLARRSEEGDAEGLGWIAGTVERFRFSAEAAARDKLKVPNIGWREVEPLGSTCLFPARDGRLRFYFAHSYHLRAEDDAIVIARARYGIAYAAAVRSGNLYGVQFHPEKSHRFGLDLLRGFAKAGAA
jgi:glutamine amidotransferase